MVFAKVCNKLKISGLVWYGVMRIEGLTLVFLRVLNEMVIEKIDVPVSVYLAFDHKARRVYPRAFLWEGKKYVIEKVGLWHKFLQGRTLVHVFTVASGEVSFRLELNSETLFWRLKEISDGMAN